MLGNIEKKSVIAVALLGLGMFFVANPVYTQASSGTAQAEAVELNLSQPSAQELTQFSQASLQTQELPEFFYNVEVAPFAALSDAEQNAFLTGLDGIYTGTGENVRSIVSYEGSIYIGNRRQTEVGPGFVYQEASDNDTFLIERESIEGSPAEAFETALEEGQATLDNRSIVLSGYDYVVDNGFYALETSRNTTNGNTTVLTVSRAPSVEVFGPLFTSLEEVEPPELRESLIAALDEPQVLDPEYSSDARQYQFVSYEGSLYQMRYQQASVPITDALSIYNFAGMGVGILLILGGLYMMREVYKERTQAYLQ